MAVTVLWNLSINQDNKTKIVKAGALPGLIGLMSDTSFEGREYAAKLIECLAVVQMSEQQRIEAIELLTKSLDDKKPDYFLKGRLIYKLSEI